jgi:hypothetical protein
LRELRLLSLQKTREHSNVAKPFPPLGRGVWGEIVIKGSRNLLEIGQVVFWALSPAPLGYCKTWTPAWTYDHFLFSKTAINVGAFKI